jgi:hypothetical protein
VPGKVCPSEGLEPPAPDPEEEPDPDDDEVVVVVLREAVVVVVLEEVVVVGLVVELVLVDPDPLPKSCTKAAKLLGFDRVLSRLELYCQYVAS